MKKRYRIDAKSMLEKGMPKVCKMMPKGSQNESQNPSKIAKILKKGMQKLMLEFDAEKKFKSTPK